MSPTRGEPLKPGYFPSGVQFLVAVRPAALMAHPEGEKILDALGPSGRRGVQLLDEIQLTPRGVQQLMIGTQVTSDGKWRTSFTARLSDGESAEQYLRDRLPNAIEKVQASIKYRLAGAWAYYAPAADRELLVIAPDELIADIIDLTGDPPPLRRDVERLLRHTDTDRHVTILFAPNMLKGEGQGLFRGELAQLRSPLFWFLGDELSAAAVSLHWDDNFFVELLAVPTLDTSPERAARFLSERFQQISDPLEDYVVGLNAHPYGRRVVARFPAMVRKLAAYTRSGFSTDHAMLRCYLPTIAGHNLLMGAELVLAESTSRERSDWTAPSSAAAESISPPDTANVRERLQRPTSLAFPRDTLEAALVQLSRDTTIEIVIAGADLQAEGITKNQSFGINIANQPAGKILVEILRLANPDKSATGPDDPRQKLVYVIRDAEPYAASQIVVTTRSAAAARQEELPPVFRAKSP
jgi:hypothetical protein